MKKFDTKHHKSETLKISSINTKLGSMIAVSDESALYLLKFRDDYKLEKDLSQLKLKLNTNITFGTTSPIVSIELELNTYFDGQLQEFTTPIHPLGTTFQKLTWNALKLIPYGQTSSYLEQSIIIRKQTAYRAVANANGSNKLAIIVPCHRIINHNGNLCGYSAGITRKKWLIDHENNVSNKIKNSKFRCQ